MASAAAVAVNLGVYPQAIGIVRGGGGVAARSFYYYYYFFVTILASHDDDDDGRTDGPRVAGGNLYTRISLSK